MPRIPAKQLSDDVLTTQAAPTGGTAFSAKQRLLSDLLDPASPQDAVTLAYLIAYVEAQMDYSNAVVDKPIGFVAAFKSAAPAAKRCVDIDYQIRGAADVSLFLQIHDIAAATPAALAEALICRAVSALDGDTWAPVGTWLFVNGIFIGLSTTDRVWTPSADQYLFPVVRYLP